MPIKEFGSLGVWEFGSLGVEEVKRGVDGTSPFLVKVEYGRQINRLFFRYMDYFAYLCRIKTLER